MIAITPLIDDCAGVLAEKAVR